MHIHLPDAMVAQLDELCARTLTPRSRFIQRAVQLAIDDARMVFGTEAANEPVAAPGVGAMQSEVRATIEAQRPAEAAGEGEIATILRGPVTWFDLNATLDFLGVSADDLKKEIDPTDDILNYQGKDWIDDRGIAEVRALCRDNAVSDKFWAWAQTKMQPT
ncbi:MAG: ribbon-helix-helix domain-containing protein [Rhodococcus sp. (in: high G+C Gram-positive bacteria)]